MIVLMVWDGLRPDMIDAQRTPFLYQMAGEGIFCRASHALFPTVTRVNSASLATGCYPGRHGIVDNELYVPAIDPRRPVSCGNWDVLQAMADLEHGRVVEAATVGEILQASGKRMCSAGSGSQGTVHLTNPTTAGPIVHWATAWPREAKEDIERRYGAFLGPESTSSERNRFVLRAALDYLVNERRPDLLTMWLVEPDTTQHRHGLATPEATAVLAELDQQFERFWDAITHTCGEENLTCLFLSDHGYSTITQRVDPEQKLIEAGLKASPDSCDIVRASNSLYLAGKARERLGDVVRFLLGEPWLGALFVRDDLLEACPEAMPQSAVFGAHRRSADVMFAFRWSPVENDYGVPGCVVSGSTRNVATHGSASPYDVNNCLVAWGKDIKKGVISAVPCGYVDVAPTVLHLLGIKPPPGMAGRVLHEILEGGPPPGAVAVSRETQENVCQTAAGPRRQVAQYSHAGGHRYLDQVALTV
jgi:arylsulfatase A-like enzyme